MEWQVVVPSTGRLAGKAVLQVKHFSDPQGVLGGLDVEQAAGFIAATADVALVLASDGSILDVVLDEANWPPNTRPEWLGKSWTDTVTTESQPKIRALLQDATDRKEGRWRQVNHPAPWGADIPVQYLVQSLGTKDRLIAVGRDLRDTSLMQQRLLDAQQSMERHYARLRHVETRYRLLFQMTAEPVLIVDAASLKIAEANAAAASLLGMKVPSLIGNAFPVGLEQSSMQAVHAAFANVRVTGRADEMPVTLAGGAGAASLSVALFRQENTSLFLVRLLPSDERRLRQAQGEVSTLAKIFQTSPDGYLVTDDEGRILHANTAFLDLVQLATEEQVRGRSLDQWLDRPGVDLNVLIANLRQHGTVRQFATKLRGEYGVTSDVEVSATSVLEGEETRFGLTVQNVGRRTPTIVANDRELPRSVEQLTELVGRVPLKDLVRETTDVIERLCIEAALELTGDNRASAAEILGLSRQSLYVKLRRYGLADGGSDGET